MHYPVAVPKPDVAVSASIAEMLLDHGITIRDFILISFLYDQGPMTILQLARIVSIGHGELLTSIKRLAAVGLVIRNPIKIECISDTTVQLTRRGEKFAVRINAEI